MECLFVSIGLEMANKANECGKAAVFLKCYVSVKTEDGSEVFLTLPESRQTRENLPQEDLAVLEHLVGFKGRMQKNTTRILLVPIWDLLTNQKSFH